LRTPQSRPAPAFDDRGTLKIGAPADVAIMEPTEGPLEFLDNYKGTRAGHQRLFLAATVFAGKRTPHARSLAPADACLERESVPASG
jgi:dihydroorotase